MTEDTGSEQGGDLLQVTQQTKELLRPEPGRLFQATTYQGQE